MDSARHGGKVVFFGRFTALLRALVALLAGANGMAWSHFLPFNMLGGLLWAALYRGGSCLLGSSAQRIAGPVGITLAVLVAADSVVGVLSLHRHETRLAAKAERAFPGPLAPPAVRLAAR